MKQPATPKSSTAAQALLESGREHSPLRYNVEAGLARHQQQVQNAAPMPSWASAPGALPGSALTWRIVKLLIAGAVLGPLVVAIWSASEPPSQRAPVPAAAAPPAIAVADAVASSAPSASDPLARAPETPARASLPAKRSDQRTASRVRAAPAATEAAPAVPSAASVAEAAQPEQSARNSSDAPAPHAGPARSGPGRAAPEQRPELRDHDEVGELALAERLLASAPQRALAVARSGDARFPDGYLRQERAYVAIMALIELGELDQARTQAERFFARYASTPYGARIRRALEVTAVDASSR